jgi:holo-[acyl-carrier protein] synthase
MIVGIGVDLCPVARMERILGRHGKLFLDRVFTDEEQAYAGQAVNQAERLAARFAAKEAVIKALGGAPPGLRWKDIEVIRQGSGAPCIVLRGAAEERASTLQVGKRWISLTHAGGSAVAMVVLESN